MTATATVTVVEIQSVEFTGISDHYRISEQFDTSNIKVIITDTEGNKYERRYNANVTLPTLTLDITKSEEIKEYTFKYLDAEYKKNIEVYATLEDAELIGIEYDGDLSVFRDEALEVSVKANYTYGLTATYTKENGVTASEFSTAALGNYDITVTYQGMSVTATVAVIMPKVTNIVIVSAPIGIQNEAYRFDAVNVVLTLENNETVPDTLENLVDYGIIPTLDVTTAGNNVLTLTTKEGVAFTSTVTVYEIEKIVIDTTGFKTMIQTGTSFSTDELTRVFVYLKGVQEPQVRTVEQSAFTHDVQVGTKGKYTLTAVYLNVTSEPVQITVTDQNFVITGAGYADSINAWNNKTYSDKYLDSGYAYAVGDDNPFKFEINFKLFDVINQVPGSGGLVYEGLSTVTLDGVAVGEKYVLIDEVAHTFDFTEAAVGKTFVITTAHKDYPEYQKTFTVNVVDAYNVTSAIELNLLTNYNISIGNSGKNMMQLLYPFLASNNVAGIQNMTYEQYTAFADSINGIVIHNNLILNTSDFPTEYFFTTASGEKYLWDHQSVFYRVFREIKLEKGVAPEVFNLYGNYFTIVSNNIPIVAPKGTVDKNGVTTNNGDELSSSDLIRINTSDTIRTEAAKANKYYAENYQFNVYALGIHDNDPSVPVQSELAQIRSKLGIIGFKVAHATYNFNAVNAEAYFNTLMAEYDDLIVNLDYCTFYNAWNNHISTWATNQLDMNSSDNFDGSVHEGYQPIIVNVTNSFVAKSGGPVIMSFNKNPEQAYNKQAGSRSVIDIDENTTIFSYVTGEEAWFVAYGATKIMNLAESWNSLYEAQKTKSSFMVTINGKKYFNMIYLNMDGDFNPATGVGATSNVDGSISIAENKKVDMDDSTNGQYGHGGIVDYIRAQAPSPDKIPIVLVSDQGGVTYTNNVDLFTVTDNFANGNYLAGYLYNLGFLFGFNETDMVKEPDPASCTTVTKVTELHGYVQD